jgi:predicted DNA-binding transcriptional regulator YafY
MKPTPHAVAPLTAERAVRLHKFLKLIAGTARARTTLLAKLSLDTRGFYRDVRYLREVGVEICTAGDKYLLTGELESARGRIPLPDPGLTLEEATQLARGTTAAHKKLKALIDAMLGGSAKSNGHSTH